MTTRNQKKKESAKSKPSSSTSHGVDFQNQPIVALPAMNPPPSQQDLAAETATKLSPHGLQPESTSILKNPSSSPLVATHSATPTPAAAVTPVRCTTSNPVLRDICALKSGELKVVSPAVSKYFGFPAGPVEKLNFSDPKVADYFNIPLPLSDAEVRDAVPVAGASVETARTEIAALVPISDPATSQKPTAAVSPTPVAPLKDSIPSSTVVGGSKVIDGSSARPIPMAAENLQSTSHSTTPVASWAGLFKGNRTLTDDTKMNPNFDGVTTEDVVLDDVDLDDEGEEKRSLIGFFNGKFPGINAVQRIVDDWPRKCSFHLHNSGWLVFEFDEEKDCEIVLKEGPYYAFNKPLVLKQMPEFFDFSDEAYSTAPVWIQLHNLPLRAWKKSALEKICSFLGTPLHIDQVTKEKTQKSFARCLVEVDVSKDLPNLVCCRLPRGKVLRQHVLYEETPTFCSNCKKLGHETEDCYAKSNGMPTLYVTKSKKEREKKNGIKQGIAGGVKKNGKGAANAAPRPKGTPAVPVDDAVPKGANDKGLGPVSRPNESAGIKDGGTVTRQPASTPNAPVLNNVNAKGLTNKNGKVTNDTAKDPGIVSTNSFGPLANEKIGSWANEAKASNAKNNNKKKNNVKN